MNFLISDLLASLIGHSLLAKIKNKDVEISTFVIAVSVFCSVQFLILAVMFLRLMFVFYKTNQYDYGIIHYESAFIYSFAFAFIVFIVVAVLRFIEKVIHKNET